MIDKWSYNRVPGALKCSRSETEGVKCVFLMEIDFNMWWWLKWLDCWCSGKIIFEWMVYYPRYKRKNTYAWKRHVNIRTGEITKAIAVIMTNLFHTHTVIHRVYPTSQSHWQLSSESVGRKETCNDNPAVSIRLVMHAHEYQDIKKNSVISAAHGGFVS